METSTNTSPQTSLDSQATTSLSPSTEVAQSSSALTPEQIKDPESGSAESTGVKLQVASAAEPNASSSLPLSAPSTPSNDAQVMARSRMLWRVLPKTETNDPTEDTRVDARHLASGGMLIGASRCGRSHLHDGKYCEDSFHIALAHDWVIMAVADGTGSKSLARVGSKVAARVAAESLQKSIEVSVAPNRDMVIPNLKRALVQAVGMAYAELEAEAAFRVREVNDLSTTLILVAYRITPGEEMLGCLQIGDGGVVVQRFSGECMPITQPDRGAHAGETRFLTNRETVTTWPQRVFISAITQPIRVIVAATDGVMDDFVPPLGELENLFQAIEPFTAEAPETASKSLVDWLNYERRGSFDDRTLTVLILPATDAGNTSPTLVT